MASNRLPKNPRSIYDYEHTPRTTERFNQMLLEDNVNRMFHDDLVAAEEVLGRRLEKIRAQILRNTRMDRLRAYGIRKEVTVDTNDRR